MTRCASRAPRGDKADQPRAKARARELSMKRTFKGAVGAGVATVALLAGLTADSGRLAEDRKLAQRRRRHLELEDHPCLQQALSRHQGRIRALGAERIQRRPQRAARRRHRRRPHHLPSVRRLARALSEAPARRRQRPQGMDNFSDVAKAAWQTDDGKTTFCVPIASVIAGFIYNKEAFAKVGVSEPKTLDEFHAVLEKLKKDGTYVPLVMGTADQWEAATMGFQNIGPDYWKGETGRTNLIAGNGEVHRPAICRGVQGARKLGALSGHRASRRRPIADSQNLFSLGKGAIYPGRLVGHLDLPRPGEIRHGRVPAAAAGRRPAAATSPTTPTSRWASTRPRRTRTTRRSS